MTKREEEKATLAEALNILEAIQQSLIWTYGGGLSEHKPCPAGHLIPSESGLVGRLKRFVDNH